MNNKIRHVFVVMFENRSFDHMLGFSKISGKDAVTNENTTIDGIPNPEDFKEEYPLGSGNFYRPDTGAPYSLIYDPLNEFKDTLWQLTGVGNLYTPNNYPKTNNKSFIATYARYDRKNLGANMKCFTEDQLAVLHTLAREFVVCDRWFSSMPGHTWPNRFFLHAATSGGLLMQDQEFN